MPTGGQKWHALLDCGIFRLSKHTYMMLYHSTCVLPIASTYCHCSREQLKPASVVTGGVVFSAIPQGTNPHLIHVRLLPKTLSRSLATTSPSESYSRTKIEHTRHTIAREVTAPTARELHVSNPWWRSLSKPIIQASIVLSHFGYVTRNRSHRQRPYCLRQSASQRKACALPSPQFSEAERVRVNPTKCFTRHPRPWHHHPGVPFSLRGRGGRRHRET